MKTPNRECEEAVIEKIRLRRNVGRKKYGTTMEREDLSRRQWLQHAQEEAMDLAIYLERLIREESSETTCETPIRVETKATNRKCPKCNCTLLENDAAEWCSFIGGREEKACDYIRYFPSAELRARAEESKEITARAATIDELLSNVVPNFLQPPPSRDTLRAWLDAANVPRMKSNPHAKRGGGPCYYSVPAVEKLLRSRMLPGRIATP